MQGERNGKKNLFLLTSSSSFAARHNPSWACLLLSPCRRLTFPSRRLTCAVRRELVQMSAETKGKTQVFHFGYAECGLTCAVRRELVQMRAEWQEKRVSIDIPEPIGFASITRRKQKTGVIYAIPPPFSYTQKFAFFPITQSRLCKSLIHSDML